jgi:hypothetical protein
MTAIAKKKSLQTLTSRQEVEKNNMIVYIEETQNLETTQVFSIEDKTQESYFKHFNIQL